MSLTIKVTDYDDLRGHIEYAIEVRDPSGENWCFKRRYSALRFFHELLKKSEKNVPKFPPKKLFGNLNPDFLDTRRRQIEQYFNALTHIPEIFHSSAFKDFIKPFDKAPIIRTKRIQKKILTKEVGEAIENAVKKIIEEEGKELVSLAPVVGVSGEELEKARKEYEEAVRELEFEKGDVWPISISENRKKLERRVEKWFGIGKALEAMEIVMEKWGRVRVDEILSGF
jgi:hypothetical protein